MGRAILDAERPAMWDIESGPDGVTGGIVRLGKRKIRICEIEDVALEETRDRNDQGLILGAMVFICLASLFAYLVFDAGWRARFLLGTGFLAYLSIAGFREAASLKTLTLYEMTVTLRNGERVVFTSADREDIEALALRLMAARARGV